MRKVLPPLVVTKSRLLLEQLRLAEQHCGLDFDYHDNIPDARHYAVRREAIILGSDLLPLVRKPWRCRGVVLAAHTGPTTLRLFEYGERAGVAYAIELPNGLPLLIDVIHRAHHTRPAGSHEAQR